ncbi:hypothetical protein Y032_0004g1873 [Ancylostoma ceylanicum]|uniref:Uncharacterized protein n=1 Tax=Ancylostoma ceylanicum TaxID=53326 RepID=A0A016VTP9_9BILA|nr:hypothetical protein Y032_0004g1873 [Ancylostoma ceylanicum]
MRNLDILLCGQIPNSLPKVEAFLHKNDSQKISGNVDEFRHRIFTFHVEEWLLSFTEEVGVHAVRTCARAGALSYNSILSLASISIPSISFPFI